MFVSSASGLLALVLTAVALYATTLVLVRVAGRRTVSQLSAFDALITIALGSVFATSIVSNPPSYERGVTAVATLVLLQVIVGAARQRSPRLRRFLDFSPQTIYERSTFTASRHPLGPQVSEDELDAAIRAAGYDSRDRVVLVVLESDGRFSVLPDRISSADS